MAVAGPNPNQFAATFATTTRVEPLSEFSTGTNPSFRTAATATCHGVAPDRRGHHISGCRPSLRRILWKLLRTSQDSCRGHSDSW